MMSQSLWLRYGRRFVGITWHNVWSQWMKIYIVIQTKFNQFVEENVHEIVSLPTKRIQVTVE